MSMTGVGFQIEYPAITLHAVSRAESGPSIYCQLDESFRQVNGGPPGNEDEYSEMRELTIVPKTSDSCMISLIPPIRSYLIPLFYKWSPFLKHYLNVLLSILTHMVKKMTWTMPSSMSMVQLSKLLLEMKMKNLVRLGGCAVILSMTTALRPTRPFTVIGSFCPSEFNYRRPSQPSTTK